eukprot:CAMPEP_0194445204 /NCGR_PEP_ID=MMETSP0176-20130528/127725_1 /TAXON_ID=216777 /ORGANISM="Proboscia alata, Strain PI-D3" /LENGTH=490 /DNA_ID=CAMNT_0039271723 /DNA_START=112 /DNA_END=1582 /DNA_ORIENTATION=+
MRHKRRLVEVLGGVWVLCVLLVSTTAGSHRTLGVIPFVNKSVLTCRGGSSATEDDVNTAPKRRMLFRRDRPSTNREIDKSGDETESDDDSDEPKLNRWWQTNQRSPTALETNGAELSLDDTLDDDNTPYLFGSVTFPSSTRKPIWRRAKNHSKPSSASQPKPAPKPTKTKTVVILQFGSRGGLMTPEEPSTPTSASGGATALPTNSLEELRDSISFLVSQYQPPNHDADTDDHASDDDENSKDSTNMQHSELEIILLLESPGGSASFYGLAAAQLSRLRNLPNATLTICVDQVAASGGYMMACLASPDRLYASPFASVGSIGVITSLLNYRKGLQQKLGIEPIVVKAGKNKNVLCDIAEVTKEGLKLVQEDLDRVHTAFCTHVAENRLVLWDNTTDTEENPITSQPSFSGRVWIGRDAMTMGLVDRIISSDDYIGELLQSKENVRVLRLYKYRPKAYRSMWGSGGGSNSMWDYFTRYKGTVMQLGTSLFG